MIITSFLICLLFFILIGSASILKKKSNSEDYLLASQSVKPWLVALSAIATNNSGYMFIGVIGYTYTVGLSVIWLIFGFIFGDFLASLFCHKKLRQNCSANSLSFSSVIAGWQGKKYKIFQAICGIFVIIFLATYSAAQLNAGSKALHVLFDWKYSSGAIIGSIIILIYCLVGGIRASIWTNSAQSFIMIFAMFLLFAASIIEIGGFSSFAHKLHEIDPNYLSLFPTNIQDSAIKISSFVLGYIILGLGVIGQPHIMLSFMTMEKPKDITKIRFYYYGWYILFASLTILVAMCAKILLAKNGFDAEIALPRLSEMLLPEILVGLILAALFAATMSTADSQIISCSASLSNDFGLNKKNSYIFSKIATILVTIFALFIALNASKTVFSLVIIAWSALASFFMPILTLLCFNKKFSEFCAICVSLGGFLAMILWRNFGFKQNFHEAGVGILVGFLIYFIFTIFKKK